MGAGQSSERSSERSSEELHHPDLPGEGFYWNGKQHGHYPGMLALPTAPVRPTPSEPSPPALPAVPWELIDLINRYRVHARDHPEEYDPTSILPAWIWEKTTSSSRWSFPDLCMVFGNPNFQTWAYRRYVDGTRDAELEVLDKRLSMWLFAAATFEENTLRTREIRTEQNRIETQSHMRKVDRLFAYFKLLNKFCTYDRYENIRKSTVRP